MESLLEKTSIQQQRVKRFCVYLYTIIWKKRTSMKSSKLYSLIINHKWLGIAILLTLVWLFTLFPHHRLGPNTQCRIHDNMDSTMVWYKLLAESGQIFTLSDVEIPNAINGLPRSTLPSGLDATLWMYLLFKPMTVYIINQTLMRFVALFGMYLL